MKSDHNSNSTILAIDDAEDILLLLEFELSEEGYKVLTAKDGYDAFDVVSRESVDLILLDIEMPNLSGLQMLEQLKSNSLYQDIPVIMLSGSEQSADIVSALDLGANDFVNKPYLPEVLLARIRTSLRLLEKNRELEKMALTDFLTGINNRRQFYHLTSAALSKNQRHQSSLTIAIFDIDHFKQVNDTYGHDIGDMVLVEFSKLLVSVFREYDICGRVGGEEFAICLPDTGLENGKLACERFNNALKAKQMSVVVERKLIKLSVTTSIGVTTTTDESNIELLIKQADKALYDAKLAGRDCVRSFVIEN